jgi:DNA-binding NarL/FixJ family response regulator
MTMLEQAWLDCRSRPTQVLLVEDDPAVRALFETVSRTLNCEIVEACTADAARELLTSRAFDFALLDLKLPDASGTEVFLFLRDRYPDVAAVIFSAYLNDTVVDELSHLGAGLFVPKPTRLDTVVTVLRSLGVRPRVTEESLAAAAI